MNEMVEKLSTYDVSCYPRMWCQLNGWEFPDELIEFKPTNWELLPILEKDKIISPATKYIKDRISEKELLREWNKDRMTDQEFEEFWANRKPLSKEAIQLLKEIFIAQTKQN